MLLRVEFGLIYGSSLEIGEFALVSRLKARLSAYRGVTTGRLASCRVVYCRQVVVYRLVVYELEEGLILPLSHLEHFILDLYGVVQLEPNNRSKDVVKVLVVLLDQFQWLEDLVVLLLRVEPEQLW